jgi:glyoxylase-like metal-dependent hydrolase (beta-lactamase superfamily II)
MRNAEGRAIIEGMRLSNRCYAVTGLGYVSPWCVNAGFVVGGEITLVVDTGGNTLAAQSIYGYASTAKPDNKLQVINTEGHFDHIGGNGYFRGLGIDVWGHTGIERTPEQFKAEIAEFNDSIGDPVRRARMEAHAFFYQTQLTLPNCRIHNETTFNLGGMDAEILFTPGHTKSNLSVWVPEDGVLYTGDCVIREYLPNLDAGNKADWQKWLESLDRIEQLKPEVVVGGHGPVSRGGEIVTALDSMRNVLRESIARGSSPTGRGNG